MWGHFCLRLRKLDAFRFLAERKCPIHFREFPVPAAVAQRFRRDGETSKLFRLGLIILWFRLHGRHSGFGLVPVNLQVQPAFRAPQLNLQ